MPATRATLQRRASGAVADRPLDPITSIKVKIGLLVTLSIVAQLLVFEAGNRAGVPGWLTVPVTVAAALAVVQWLARGMTSPLREMTRAAGRMAGGDYSAQVTATSADEVGELARAFNTMASDLATSDQQRRQLVATVSHELRTPLAAQRALLENLVDGVVKPDDAALQSALTQSERLSALVSDLLDVSRVDEGAVPLNLASLGVRDFLDRSVGEVGVGGRSIRIEVAVAPVDLEVRADPDRLAQVVANLLDNAVRHSPPDGIVRVRAAAEADALWSLEVSDDGPGIPPDRLQRLFTRFGSGDDSSGSTGLGLAIASWVCRLHGGTIAALPLAGDLGESAAGAGSGARIRAMLPRDPAPRAPAPATSTGSVPPESTIRSASSPLHADPLTTRGKPVKAIQPMTQDVVPVRKPIEPMPSLMESATGDFWPDAGPRTASGPLFASLAIGVLAALVVPMEAEIGVGLGGFVVLVLSGALVFAIAKHRQRAWTWFCVVLCLGLAALLVLRAAEWLAVLSVLVAGVLVTTSLTDAKRTLPIFVGAASWVLSGVRGLPLLRRTIALMGRHRMLWPVLRTAVISVVALAVFAGLFASGDPVFGSWLSALLPDVTVADTLVMRVFVWFFISGIVLAACYLAVNPPRVESLPTQPARAVDRAWEWIVPVGVVIAVFIGFLAAQASAMWGGHDFVRNTTGLSYAEYVHQGFGQLTVATLLTLVTIGLAAHKAARTTARDRWTLRLVLGTLCVLTLVVVASAMFRMAVYQQAYGFTVLRLLVDAFELWLGVLVVFVMVAGWRLSGWWLPRAALASGAAMLLVIGLVNPSAWVAQQNIDRYLATGKLDLMELSELGPDAMPVVKNGLPASLSSCVIGNQFDPSRGEWLQWNFGRARAAALRAENPSLVWRTGCPAHVG